MAAHTLRMLRDFKNYANDNDGHLISHACMYTQGMDIVYCFEALDLYRLAEDKNWKAFLKMLDVLIERYERVWEFLGKPSDMTQWKTAVYSLKTTRLGKYRKMTSFPYLTRFEFMGE